MERDGWLEERLAWMEGFRCVVGVDEAGRGALAGPVVAAAVVFPAEYAPGGIDDSKALTPAQREQLFERIRAMARGVGVGVVGPDVIDRINVLQATHQAMREAVGALPAGLRPDMALIDGLPVRPFPISQTALVHGDSRSISIAAASIIAKVTRDRVMVEYDAIYPQYGFAVHKGYCVPAHLHSLKQHGPSPIHRRSFSPVADCFESDAALTTEPVAAADPPASSSDKADGSRTRKPRRSAPNRSH